MTQKKRQTAPKRETRTRGERSSATASGARDGDSLVEATHQVVEDEMRKGEAPPAPGPDQKGEPGSSV